MDYTLKELCEKLGATFSGEGNISISHTCGLEKITDGGLAYISNPAVLASLPTPGGVFDSRQKDLAGLKLAERCALIVPTGTPSSGQNLIFSSDPLDLHVQTMKLLHEEPVSTQTVHPDAYIGEGVVLGKNVTVDAKAVIYDGAQIGDNTTIRAGVVVMHEAIIGEDCLIYPNVTIREQCRLGNRVIVHPNAVIGADGFGFYQREGANLKIPQVGIVIVEDDVEIGASTTIDRARFYETIIGKGSKLDNLVHVAHNVILGDHALITAQSGIAGSCRIGDHLMMGGQSGIRDNLTIGNRVSCLARTVISSNTKDNQILAGVPSRPIEKWRQVQGLINSLDRINSRLKKVERLIRKFTGKK